MLSLLALSFPVYECERLCVISAGTICVSVHKSDFECCLQLMQLRCAEFWRGGGLVGTGPVMSLFVAVHLYGLTITA